MLAVIGGSFFIGTRLAKRLKARGEKISIVDKRLGAAFPYRTRVAADVTHLESLTKALVDASVTINLSVEHRDDVGLLSHYDKIDIRIARSTCEEDAGNDPVAEKGSGFSARSGDDYEIFESVRRISVATDDKRVKIRRFGEKECFIES